MERRQLAGQVPPGLNQAVRTGFGQPVEDADVIVSRTTAILNALQEFVGIVPNNPRRQCEYFSRIDAACGPGTALRWRTDHQRLAQQLADRRGFFRPALRVAVPLSDDLKALIAIARGETT